MSINTYSNFLSEKNKTERNNQNNFNKKSGEIIDNFLEQKSKINQSYSTVNNTNRQVNNKRSFEALSTVENTSKQNLNNSISKGTSSNNKLNDSNISIATTRSLNTNRVSSNNHANNANNSGKNKIKNKIEDFV